MNVIARAKINIGLNVVHRRTDGYHDIESLFIPIGLSDTIYITPAEGRDTTLTVCGRTVEGSTNENLVMRAARLLSIPPVDITLNKHIPTGAGLGGGSSDAAATLKALNNMFELNLSGNQMRKMLSSLGADCPFFVDECPQFAEGIGNILTPVSLPPALHGMHFVLIKPTISVSTREAYMGIRPRPTTTPILFALSQPANEWKKFLRNDFEATVFDLHPDIAALKRMLYECGAIYAQMSGSGSAVFALFDTAPSLPSLPPDYFLWQEYFE